jgi:hypothetical protein
METSYAKLDKYNNVINIEVASEEWVNQWKQDNPDSEFKYVYTNYDVNPAEMGGTYDEEKQLFIPKKPFNSWILNEELNVWEPPVVMPTDDKPYSWNEELQQWEELILE